MNSPDEQWWSARAGEYVIGTLRDEELHLFERLLLNDADMRSEVLQWEKRLSPLNAATRSVSPGEHIWPAIKSAIRARADSAQPAVSAQASSTDAAADKASQQYTSDVPRIPASRASDDESPGDTLSELEVRRRKRSQSRLWPAVATFATAASLVLAVLAGTLWTRQGGLTSGGVLSVDGVAVVLSDESGEPYFLVETDYEGGRVKVTALGPPDIEDERNFQLWQAVPDRSSVRPVAQLPREAGNSRVFEITTLIDGSDLFGVSIEPEGAPTDAGPTGPVVAHGDFLETRADQ